MPAGPYDFELDQGASWSTVVAYQDSSGNPINLTGWAAAMQIRLFKAASDPLVAATCVIDGTAGTVTLSLTRAQTAALPAKTPLFYDVLITNGTQGIRLIEGQITLDQAVTEVA